MIVGEDDQNWPATESAEDVSTCFNNAWIAAEICIIKWFYCNFLHYVFDTQY